MIFINEDKYKNNKGIYCIRNLLNNKRYVGQTAENFQRRYLHHRWKLNNNSHDNEYLQKSWNKNGSKNFVFEIIEIIDDISKLDEMEIKYITLYKEKKLSYNMLLGGQGRRGFKMKESAKKLIGQKNKEHMTGRKHNQSTKYKMSQSRSGQPYTRYKKTTIINEEIAYQIKEMLINGITTIEISSNLDISYNVVNGILSNNTWDNVKIEGWEEFQNNRLKTYRLTKEDAKQIRRLAENGMKINDIAKLYNKERHTISNIIHYRTFKE